MLKIRRSFATRVGSEAGFGREPCVRQSPYFFGGMKRVFLIALLTAAGFGASRAAIRDLQSYNEICDASAAVALDDKHFVVGDDEGNTLRIYERGKPESVGAYDLSRFLIDRKRGGEFDLEGAARVGDRIYWITSHGRNRDGEFAPNRHRFFAMQILADGKKLEPIGKPYSNLLNDMLADKRFDRFSLLAASKVSPKSHNGLNIEGICARADGSLLIGFRNPVPNGKSLLLPLLNPAEVIEGKTSRFGEMIELDLDDRGVRDITQDGDRFLILAGQSHHGKNSQLYSWDGKNPPTEIRKVKFGKLNPEAFFRFPSDPSRVFQVLSDDGGENVGGMNCKDLPVSQRRFRAGEIKLPH
jgi:hypothetical protein